MKTGSKIRSNTIILILLIIGPINFILSQSYLYYYTNNNNIIQHTNEPNISYTGTTGTLAWSRPILSPNMYSSVIGDVDNDGFNEIIIINNTGTICLNGLDGNEKWRSQTAWAGNGGLLLYDVDTDGQKEIIVGGVNELIYCLSGSTGDIEWSWTPGYELGYAMPSIGDVDGDDDIEILMRCKESPSNLTCLSFNGDIEWQVPGFPSVNAVQDQGQILADIDNDGKIEVLIGGTDGYFYCLSGEDGSIEWDYLASNSRFSLPAIGDVDFDGDLEVVVGSDDGKIYCFSKDGEMEWVYNTSGYNFASPALANINSDAYLEVIIGSRDNCVYCLSGNLGSYLWDYNTTGEVDGTSAIADIDGDGYLEVIVGSKSGTLFCLSGANGFKEWEFPTGGGISSSPTIGDVDNDGILEIIFGASDGILYCLKGNGPEYAIPSPWPCYAGSAWHTGYYIDDDGDGIPTPLEKSLLLNSDLSDSDSDGLDDSEEIELYNTNPLNNDTDSDGMTDGWEIDKSLNPNIDTDAENDEDNDLLNNLGEFNAGTNPHNNDTDGDGLGDGEEVLTYETDPLDEDTDDDTYSDGEEIDAGTDPLDSESYPVGDDNKSFLDKYLNFILIGLISVIGIMGIVITIIVVKPKFLEQKQIKNKITKVKENIESFKHELVSFIIDKMKNQYGEHWWDLGIPESVKKDIEDKVNEKIKE